MRTNKTTSWSCRWMLLLLLSPPLAFAQAAPTAASAAATDVDKAAVAALDRMGATLRSLDHFALTSDASTEVVLDNGQKIQLESQVMYRVQRPDKITVDIKSDRKHRQLFYDGDHMTVYAPRLKFYASVDDVGKTLGELIVGASEKYGVEFPLTDLFFWGTDKMAPDVLLAAMHVGDGTLNGQAVDQYAFRQTGVDWQVWISQETRLPLKLVITSLDDPSLPQYEAQLHWDTRTAMDQTAFTFTPPEGAARISLMPLEGVAVHVEKER